MGEPGFTNILNNNLRHRLKRVVRSEDVPTDLRALKVELGVDLLYVFGHGDFEHKTFVSRAWRSLGQSMLERGANAFIGHGPHTFMSNEVNRLGVNEHIMFHSLGNIFGPKALDNAGLGLLAEFNITRAHTRFCVHPFAAMVDDDGRPRITAIMEEMERIYPALVKRFRERFPTAQSVIHAEARDC
jgi:hypothetical protein